MLFRSMVTLNALSAADSVIIPVQAQYLPAKGMTQLVQTISKVKKYINPDIKIDISANGRLSVRRLCQPARPRSEVRK